MVVGIILAWTTLMCFVGLIILAEVAIETASKYQKDE